MAIVSKSDIGFSVSNKKYKSTITFYVFMPLKAISYVSSMHLNSFFASMLSLIVPKMQSSLSLVQCCQVWGKNHIWQHYSFVLVLSQFTQTYRKIDEVQELLTPPKKAVNAFIWVFAVAPDKLIWSVNQVLGTPSLNLHLTWKILIKDQ